MERLNKSLVKILCKLISDHRRDWADFVPKAVLAYNTSVHESTGCTPYRLMFGRKASSETQGQSVGSGEKAWRKFSSTGERAPGYRLSPSYFQKFKRILAPGGAQKMLLYYCAQSANSFSHRFIVGCVGAFLLLFPFDF